MATTALWSLARLCHTLRHGRICAVAKGSGSFATFAAIRRVISWRVAFTSKDLRQTSYGEENPLRLGDAPSQANRRPFAEKPSER